MGTVTPRPGLIDQVLEQLEAWSVCEWPRNTYLYGDKGEFYVRWTPTIQPITPGRKPIPPTFTLANVTVYEEYRGQGLFTEILKRCCESEVPVIRLECIQNPRLAVWAKRTTFRGRTTVEVRTEPISVDWILV